jgi:uncharacterized protein YndB with AHSA1/START domain
MKRKGDEAVVVTVDIAAPPAIVYSFFTDPARVAAWLGSGSELGARSGDPIRVAAPNGDVAVGVIRELTERRIVFTWGYAHGTHGIAPGATTVEIELTPTAAGTSITLRHSGLQTAEQRRNHAQGWRYFTGALSNAAAHLALGGATEPAIDSYVAAWAEHDRTHRDALLGRAWSTDGVFKDGMGYVAGRDALSDYIGVAQQFMPGVTLRRDGLGLRSHGHVMFRWEMVGPNGQQFGSGWNVGELDQAGQFRWMVGFQAPRETNASP